ncbi:MAG: class I SAM-dependent RNA methyltransferase [Rhodospirillales bacterium]|nr:class I SAM-dependent RNA methyltransferase [Rhodospirillales bacterium]MBO6785682.1 class I SAM-dependent RNA methyltransferase [Rhodospirillales bacterium]
MISRIAQQGDGEAALADGTRVFVPLTLPGDEVRVQPGAKRGDGLAGTVLEWIHRKDRREPVCDVYGACGGCQLQHLLTEDYVTWKTGAVTTALSRHGLSVDLAPMQQVPLNARRRATLAFVMTAAGPMLGFKEAYSDRIVGMDSCPLLAPPLAALWVPLREFCGRIFQSPFRADLRVTTTGAGSVDIVIEADAELDLARREAIAAFAEARDVARVSWQRPGEPPEPVVQRKPVLLNIGKAEIELPMGGFVQPSTEGETILQALVSQGVGDARRVADLYCGIGTFAFVLSSDRRHVLAVDDNAAQIAALDRAAGRAGLGGYIDTAVRDLRASPLEPKAFADMDAVIFDPPRAGAKAQAEMLADSTVPRIVAVSCNPATLARDLRILTDGGYRIECLTPVDQFPMSYHVEAVAVLSRPG